MEFFCAVYERINELLMIEQKEKLFGMKFLELLLMAVEGWSLDVKTNKMSINFLKF